jgi:hypothetical protein
MKYFTNKSILIISPEQWDHIPVSKHHYAGTLASNNNTVYFLNPPSHDNTVTQSKQENVRVINYSTFRGINSMPSFARNMLNSILIKKIKGMCGGDFDVVWTFDSFRFQNLNLWNARAKIYHIVDVHISPIESELLATADVILSVSQLIHERTQQKKKCSAKINHGLAPHFLDTIATPDKSPDILIHKNGRMNAAYVGNLDNWCVDRNTLLNIVERNPDVNFHFVGPYQSESPLVRQLLQHKNAAVLGRIASQRLPALFRQMDLFLMCYNGADRVVNSNHHKVLEFLSTGKPVVINYTDEYKDKRDLVIMSDKNEELPGLFQTVCLNFDAYSTLQLATRRIEYASSNSYQSQMEKIDTLVASLFEAE